MTNTLSSSFTPESGKFYDPSDLGISPTSPPPAQSNALPNDWKPQSGKFYDPEELGVAPTVAATPMPAPDTSKEEYEARVRKYMPEASKVLAPTSSMDYVPGINQGFAGLTAAAGSILPVGEGKTFGERYQNMMAKQDAYRRAKQQDEEQRIAAQTPSMEAAYKGLNPQDQTTNALGTAFSNLPVLGSLATKIGAAAGAAGAPSWITGYEPDTSGKTFDERYLNNQAKKAAAERILAQKNPGATLVGGLAQAPLLPGAGIGNEASMLGRLGESVGTGAMYGLADTATQGENPLLGAGIGAAGGVAGHALAGGLGMLGTKIGQGYDIGKKIINPKNPEAAKLAAQKEIGSTYLDELARAPKDAQGNIADSRFITPENMATQQAAGQDVMGLDVGAGALARKARVEGVSNPNFESEMKSQLLQRHDEQKDNMKSFFKNMYGEDMDPVTLMSQAKSNARDENGPNYAAVFNHPAAQEINSPILENLTRSQAFPALAKDAFQKMEIEAIARGEKPPKFSEMFQETPPSTPTGEPGQPISPDRTSTDQMENSLRQTWGLPESKNKTDLPATPPTNGEMPPLKNKFSLEFWDAIKRVAGDKGYAGTGDQNHKDIANLVKGQLGPENLGEVGQMYHDTLATASKYFGEKDAFSMGQKLARNPNSVNREELLAGVNKLSPSAKAHTEKGFVSEAMDKVMNSTNPNATTKMLDAPNTRTAFKTLVSKEKQEPVEKFLRTQNVLNRVKTQILDQSKTMANAVDWGKGKLKGPVGTGLGLLAIEGGSELYHGIEGDEDMGGHIKALAYTGLAALMAHRYSQYSSAVSKEIQQHLLSRDPKVMQEAINTVLNSPKGLELMKGLDRATSRSTGSINAFIKNYLSPSYQQNQNRPQRKEGGSISGKTRDLFQEIVAAMKDHTKATKHTLDKHDNEIATSLQQTQQQVHHADPIHN